MKNLCALLFILLLALPALICADTPPQKALRAPLNPDFVRFQALYKAQHYNPYTPSGHALGAIPAPVDLSHTRGAMDMCFIASYPAQFDLRTQNKLTAIRDQGNCGSCWTFGAMASLESFLKPAEVWDFSEQDLNAHHGFDYAECDGGHCWMSAAYFTRYSGPLNETDVPYPYATSASSTYTNKKLQKHVQQIVFLPARANFLDNNTVKYFVTTYGAVSVTYYHDDSDYNEDTSSYYYNGYPETNHLVAVVGWDDNYPASKFNTPPPGNGAFIIKNSWGTWWGEQGFHYISYYDTSLRDFTSFNKAEAQESHQYVYNYDPLGWVYDYGWDAPTAWGANIFTAQNNIPITAVGFYLTDINTHYEISVYKNVIANQPKSGTLMASLSGSQAYPGFYTENLPNFMPINAGERFSVVIKFTNSSYGYPLAIEAAQDGYSSHATQNAGESFISYDGAAWDDLALSDTPANNCIKAFSAHGVQVTAHAERLEERSWLIKKQFGKVSFNIANPLATTVANYIIYRKIDAGDYEKLAEVAGTTVQNNTYTYYDKYIDKDKRYTYIVNAVDANSNELGVSSENEI